jgi:hypothetical protein
MHVCKFGGFSPKNLIFGTPRKEASVCGLFPFFFDNLLCMLQAILLIIQLSPVTQQLALLQGQQPKPQQLTGATLPLTNQTLATLQLQQQLAAQQQAALQSQLYGSATAQSPPLTNQAQAQVLATLQLQQQAALMSALAAQQQAASPQVATPTLPLTVTDSRKRTARAVGFEDGVSEEKKSAPTSSTASASSAVLPAVITSSSSAAVTDYASLQQQLLLLNAATAAANSNVVL